MYGAHNNYGDIGHLLADKLNARAAKLSAPVVELKNKIRATVIGAGAYSLSISGCSGYMDENILFPIRNVPVLRVDVERAGGWSDEEVVQRYTTLHPMAREAWEAATGPCGQACGSQAPWAHSASRTSCAAGSNPGAANAKRCHPAPPLFANDVGRPGEVCASRMSGNPDGCPAGRTGRPEFRTAHCLVSVGYSRRASCTGCPS